MSNFLTQVITHPNLYTLHFHCLHISVCLIEEEEEEKEEEEEDKEELFCHTFITVE